VRNQPPQNRYPRQEWFSAPFEHSLSLELGKHGGPTFRGWAAIG
jgi:hypothetical protein